MNSSDEDNISENIPQGGHLYDEDWTRFTTMVIKTENPEERFASTIYKKGDAKQDTLGLFSKLITRAASIKLENVKLADDCGFVIIVGCLRLCTNNFVLPTETVNDMISLIMTEVRHFTTKSLSLSVEYCMEYMKSSGEDLPKRWMELFGKIVSELYEHCGIEFEGDSLSGMEYKSYIINALCRLDWTSKNAVTMIAIIRELPSMDPTELNIVLEKIGSSIKSIDPPTLPPLTHQLLFLAGNTKPQAVLELIDNYFSDISLHPSNRVDANQYQQKIKALGTVVYYFIEGAGNFIVKEILRRVKASTFDNQLISSPFILTLVMGLSTQLQLTAPIIEALKSTIIKHYQEKDFEFQSSWFLFARNDQDREIKTLFSTLIASKLFNLDYVVEGLMNLGLSLLTNTKLSRESVYCANKCRELGSYLVTSVVEENRQHIPTVMKELLKCPESNSIECLALCFNSSTRQLASSPLSSKIHELITQFPLMTVEAAAPIIKSLLPVFHLSPSLLDSLLIMTRKGVWKSVQSRLVAVQALILMLSYSPIIKDVPKDKFSQTQSIFCPSQSATEDKIARYTGVFDNDSLCFEVMSILRRFFTLQLEVRQQLYLGLHSTIRLNPELTNLICTNVSTQVKLYMKEDESAVSFDKIMVPATPISSLNPVTIEEDLGLLIQCLCCVTHRGRIVYSDNADKMPEAVEQCEELILKWIGLICQLQLNDIYDVSTLILESIGGVLPLDTVISIRNILIVQCMQVMEALLEYIIVSKTENAQEANELFKKYGEFGAAFKTAIEKKAAPSKSGKKKPAKKEAKKDNNVSVNSDFNTTKTSESSSKKLKSTMKVVYCHIIALSSIENIFRQIYKSGGKSQVTNEVVKNLKRNEKFQAFLLEIVKEKVIFLKQKKAIKERTQKMEEIMLTLRDIFIVLWKRCVSKVKFYKSQVTNSQMEDKENLGITELQLEVMLLICEMLWSKDPHDMTLLLQPFGDVGQGSYEDLLVTFFNQWQIVTDRYKSNQDGNTCVISLMAIMNVVVKAAKAGNDNVSCISIFKWCHKFMSEKNEKLNGRDTSLVETVFTLMFIAHAKSSTKQQGFMDLIERAHFKLGDAYNDKLKAGKSYWMIRSETAESVVCSFASYIEDELVYVNSIVARLKNFCHVTNSDIIRMSSTCCVLLLNLCQIASEIFPCEIKVGKCSVAITKLTPKIYISLAGIAEYFCNAINKTKLPYNSEQFTALARFVGSTLKSRVENFISFIEMIHRETAEEIFSKLKENKKGAYPQELKRRFANDTRNIPTIVYHLEKYEQYLFTLASKTSVNILAGTKLSTARDFKIDLEKMKEAMRARHGSEAMDDDEMEVVDNNSSGHDEASNIDMGSDNEDADRNDSRVSIASKKRNTSKNNSSTSGPSSSKKPKATKSSRTSKSKPNNANESRISNAAQPSTSKGLKRKFKN